MRKLLAKNANILLLLGFSVVLTLGLWEYLSSRSLTVFGLICIPLIARLDTNRKSLRFLVPCVLVLSLSFISPAKTILFIAGSLIIILYLETTWGKLNHLPLLALFIVSPVFTYVTSVFGFPIRLGLSKLVGNSLNLFTESHAEGNAIWVYGKQFFVDSACMGLKLTTTTLLSGILFMAYNELKTKKKYSFLSATLVLVIFFLLNVLSNYFRIIGLVLFDIAPEENLHGIFGLVTLIIYALMPGYFILKYFQPKVKGAELMEFNAKTGSQYKVIFPIIFMAIMSIQLFTKPSNLIISQQPTHIIPKCYDAKNAKALKLKVWKLETESSLIYLKDLGSFFSSEHHPMLCWKGSGFKLTQIKEEKIGGIELYTGVLEEKKGKLYTAWWYSNGKNTTHEQPMSLS